MEVELLDEAGGYHSGGAELSAEHGVTLFTDCCGCAVTTHNRALIEKLRDALTAYLEGTL